MKLTRTFKVSGTPDGRGRPPRVPRARQRLAGPRRHPPRPVVSGFPRELDPRAPARVPLAGGKPAHRVLPPPDLRRRLRRVLRLRGPARDRGPARHAPGRGGPREAAGGARGARTRPRAAPRGGARRRRARAGVRRGDFFCAAVVRDRDALAAEGRARRDGREGRGPGHRTAALDDLAPFENREVRWRRLRGGRRAETGGRPRPHAAPRFEPAPRAREGDGRRHSHPRRVQAE